MRIIFGPYNLGASAGTTHFLISGATGTGKTTLVSQLLKSVFSESRTPRALALDVKQDLIPRLERLGLAQKIVVCHPFDQRCSPWDMAKDIDDALGARQLADTLIPEQTSPSGDSSFFDHATRDLTSVAIQILSACTPTGDWTFRDLLLTLLYPENTKMVFDLRVTRAGLPFPAAERAWSAYCDPKQTDERTRGNIRATVNAKLSQFESIAAAWHQATEEPFSLRQWFSAESQKVLVLGYDLSARASLDSINRVIFQRAAELVMAGPETSTDQTWFLLDELRVAGRLDALGFLMLLGRSKGACVVMTFQDIEGVRAVYGHHVANELVASCSNVALLRTNSQETAEWASKMFGKFLIKESDRTTGLSGSQVTSSQTSRLVERQPIQPGQLLYLPLPAQSGVISGFFKDAASASNDLRLHQVAAQKESTVGLSSAYLPISRQSLFLHPWDAQDLARLGLNRPSGPEGASGPPVRPRN